MEAGAQFLTIRVQLLGAAAAAAESDALAVSIKDVGVASEESAAMSATSAGKVEKSAGAWRALGAAAKWGSALLVGGVGLALIKSAKQSEETAKATKTLTRLTGMSSVESSKWIEVARVRNIATKTLNMGMITFSKQINAANQGSATSIDTFKQLGISMDDLKTKSTSSLILQVADAYDKMGASAQRSALNQTLFGRSGQALLPVLANGKKGLGDLLKQIQQSGAVMNKSQVETNLKAVQSQRKLSSAWHGLEITLGTLVAPALGKVSDLLANWIEEARKGKGPLAVLSTVVKFLWEKGVKPLAAGIGILIHYIKMVVQWVIKYHVATKVATAATKAYHAVVAALVDAFQWVVNAVKNAGHWISDAAKWVTGLIPVKIAVIAIVVAFRGLMTVLGPLAHFIGGGLSAAFNLIVGALKTVWSYVKAVGKVFGDVVSFIGAILHGDFGGAVHFAGRIVADVFGGIKSVIQSVWNFIKGAFGQLKAIFEAPFDFLKGIATKIFDDLKSAAAWLVDKVKWLIDKIPSIPKIPGVSDAAGAVAGLSSATVTVPPQDLTHGPKIHGKPTHNKPGATTPGGTGHGHSPGKRIAQAIAGGLTVHQDQPIVIDGKEVARVTAKHVADFEARR